MKTKLHRSGIKGVTRIEVLAIVVIVFVLIGLFLPMHTGNRGSPERIQCVRNLKEVGLAFRVWAADHDDQFPQTVRAAAGGAAEAIVQHQLFRVFLPMSEELNNAMANHSYNYDSVPARFLCPADRRKAAPSLETMRDENISYFLGIDARPDRPNMVLMGDRNLAYWVDAKGFTEAGRLQGLVSLRTNSLVGWDRGLHKNGGNILLTDGSVQQLTSSLLRQYLPTTGDDTNRVLFPQ